RVARARPARRRGGAPAPRLGRGRRRRVEPRRPRRRRARAVPRPCGAHAGSRRARTGARHEPGAPARARHGGLLLDPVRDARRARPPRTAAAHRARRPPPPHVGRPPDGPLAHVLAPPRPRRRPRRRRLLTDRGAPRWAPLRGRPDGPRAPCDRRHAVFEKVTEPASRTATYAVLSGEAVIR